MLRRVFLSVHAEEKNGYNAGKAEQKQGDAWQLAGKQIGNRVVRGGGLWCLRQHLFYIACIVSAPSAAETAHNFPGISQLCLLHINRFTGHGKTGVCFFRAHIRL